MSTSSQLKLKTILFEMNDDEARTFSNDEESTLQRSDRQQHRSDVERSSGEAGRSYRLPHGQRRTHTFCLSSVGCALAHSVIASSPYTSTDARWPDSTHINYVYICLESVIERD